MTKEDTRKNVEIMLESIRNRAWECFYETTRLYAENSNSNEKSNPKESAFRSTNEAREFVKTMLEKADKDNSSQ